MSLSKTYSCAFCHENPGNLLTCARCKTAQYCGKECQKSDYKDHKFFCRIIAGEARIAQGPDYALYQEAVRTQSRVIRTPVDNLLGYIYDKGMCIGSMYINGF